MLPCRQCYEPCLLLTHMAQRNHSACGQSFCLWQWQEHTSLRLLLDAHVTSFLQAAMSQYMVDLEDFLKANSVPEKLATRTTAFMRYVLHRRPLHASSELLNGVHHPKRTLRHACAAREVLDSIS